MIPSVVIVLVSGSVIATLVTEDLISVATGLQASPRSDLTLNMECCCSKRAASVTGFKNTRLSRFGDVKHGWIDLSKLESSPASGDNKLWSICDELDGCSICGTVSSVKLQVTCDTIKSSVFGTRIPFLCDKFPSIICDD